MPTDCISFQESGFFSPIIVDYLNQSDAVTPLYSRFPTIDNFAEQISEKKKTFSGDRDLLADTLKRQYEGIATSAATEKNIELLRLSDTFTVTTGHQLNLFTGPLYFLYKIVTAIRLSQELKAAYPEQDFVPVYWMATEDHDFEEINHFNFRDKKISWHRQSAGPVGRLSTDGLESCFEELSTLLGVGVNAEKLRQLFSEAYLTHRTLSNATHFLANELFGAHGLVIIDPDDQGLKRQFAPYIEKELFEQTAFSAVTSTIEKFGNYNVQVNPREINLFYIEDDLRERILVENGVFRVHNTDIVFTKEEIADAVRVSPEKFSPNVIMRPLYQEVILPNLCYIGGGGEIAYWLELKDFFDAMEVEFPVLMLRNSVLLASQKQAAKADRLGLTWADVFLPTDELANRKIRQYSELPLDFSRQKDFLRTQFESLRQLAAQTDESFSRAVKAQEHKQLKGLEMLEKRLLKAEKKKHADELERLKKLRNELFPDGALQERKANFSEFFLEYGDGLTDKLMASIEPFSTNFTILTL